MKKIQARNENEKNRFYNKKKMINQFCEMDKSVFSNCTLVTGLNNHLKREFVSNMLVDSISNNISLFIDTRGLLNTKMIERLSYHPLISMSVNEYDVFKNGFPVNIFSVDPDKSIGENAINLFNVISPIINEAAPEEVDKLKWMLNEYIKHDGIFLDCSFPENCETMIWQIFELLPYIEYGSENETYIRELHRSVCNDMCEYGMRTNTWKDIFKEYRTLNYMYLNSGSSYVAPTIADMLLASLRNYRKDNHETQLDLFINDISDFNYSSSGVIKKIIEESCDLNVNVICFYSDFFPRSTSIGEIMASFEKQYFFIPTVRSHDCVNEALNMDDAQTWSYKCLLSHNAILKEITYDEGICSNIATVYYGKYTDYFKTDELKMLYLEQYPFAF